MDKEFFQQIKERFNDVIIVEYEYRIEVCMTPHPWDSKNKPYWVIFKGNCNAGFGWSETPEKAWEDANEYHKKNTT